MMMRRKPMSEPTYSEQMQEELEPLPQSYDYGEQQARLRRIQDSVAGRSDRVEDDVEHTEEYYDKNRNRPVESLL